MNFLEENTGEQFDLILEAIKVKETELRRIMTTEEKAEFANNLIRGFGRGITLTKIGQMKTRRFDKITPEMNLFYHDSNFSLIKYIEDMTEAALSRRFFGKGDANIGFATLKDSIGFKIVEAAEKDGLSQSEVNEIVDILHARFNRKAPNRIWSTYKNIAYIDVMGNVISALTQLQDPAFSMYENGVFRTIKTFARAVVGKSAITRDDVGIDNIVAEFSNESSTFDAVNKVFKMTGLTKIDRIGKETLMNSAIDKWMKRAKNYDNLSPKRKRQFDQRMITTFPEELVPRVRQDLAQGRITEEVKMLAFNELMDVQPITYSELPEKYLTGGNGRIFYMLKTFQIKLLDVFRNDFVRKIKSGNRAEVIEGWQNMFRLSTALVVMGISVDALKDLILGREFDLEDRVVDNIAKLTGFSRYTIYKGGKEGIVSAAAESILPPFNFFDNLYKDMVDLGSDGDLDKWRTVQSFPVVGKNLYYWWFDDGANARRK